MSIRQLRQQDVSIPIPTRQQPMQAAVATYEETGPGDIQYVLRLLWVSQTVSRQTTRIAERLCKEVTSITQGKAQLVLQDREGNQITMPSAPTQKKALSGFAVQFGDVTYGTLYITAHSEQPTLPSIPFVIAQLMAQVCSWLLYTFEQSVFLQGQSQHLGTPICVSLTKREREILTLMCLGGNQQSIAEKLYISPTTVGKHRQHIYEQLGVHNERDALLAAYRFGLFSILDFPNA